MPFITGAGILALTTARPPASEASSVAKSAAPSKRKMSVGLIGAASTRTTTSSAPGLGVGMTTSESSSSPLLLTRERSCSPLIALSKVIYASWAEFPAAAADPAQPYQDRTRAQNEAASVRSPVQSSRGRRRD